MRIKNLYVGIASAAISLLAIVLPHPPNFSPLPTLFLFWGVLYARNRVIASTLLFAVLVNCLLLWCWGLPFSGEWAYFTLTGYICVAVSGQVLKQRPSYLLVPAALVTGFGFWVWTNLGTWLITSLYPKTLAGLLACYVAALPFLQHQLLAALCFGAIGWLVLNRVLVQGRQSNHPLTQSPRINALNRR